MENMPRCDHDHEAADVRRLPLYDSEGKRSSAGVFVCYDHWLAEIPGGPPGRIPDWRQWQNLERVKEDDGMAIRTIVAEAPDGQQVLVVIYGDPESELHVALRGDPGELWGPPLEIKADEWSA